MIHIAVLMKPYLDLVLLGEKTIECRLTVQARAPYGTIEQGDRIYFKQSAGPYGAMAIAEHVMCEADLTPKRVREIERDYNEQIRGDAEFWKMKRDSRYATLIWLGEVEPVASGPAIRPLQGVAWLTLEEEPAWRRRDQCDQTFVISITEGNLRNNTLYVTAVRDRFPAWAIGGPTRLLKAKPMTLMLHEGPTIETDIVGPRNLIRSRLWGKWFEQHGAKPGDHVVFTPAGGEGAFFVGLSTADGRSRVGAQSQSAGR